MKFNLFFLNKRIWVRDGKFGPNTFFNSMINFSLVILWVSVMVFVINEMLKNEERITLKQIAL